MNPVVPLIIIVAALIYIGFKWNNIRTKIAFLFILFGALFLLFFGFLVVTGSSFDFSSVGSVVASLREYAVWTKGAATKVLETTGNVIGSAKNTTG